eukprot:TRINITY_DN2067_c0_g1_i2.p1 TRINITY_DN2067_c0_g1~~TRINITY_DN2067_c0_g1_i2.p1  ORF type:complete len:468 (-),score=130.03 TRINITY_DN2067_c0_g1_i2:939-2342(-)
MLRGSRSLRANIPDSLRAAFTDRVSFEKARVKALLAQHGDAVLSNATLRQCYEGSRGITTMAYEPSLLDAHEGIRFRGLSIPECQEKLVKFPGGTQPQPEAMLWLLLTGSVPTEAETRELSANLIERVNEAAGQKALKEAFAAIDNLPTPTHPMNQLVLGSVALGREARFAAAYHKGMKKPQYWEPCLEDSLDLIARLAPLAARIATNTHSKELSTDAQLKMDSSADWTGNFVQAMGFSNAELEECMRLYLTIHVDHEGGNVSAHATQLVGSALSDPYLSFSAGMAGLAGPLHGLANQEVLTFLKGMMKDLVAKGIDVANLEMDELKQVTIDYAWSVLNSGKVIPGYGHAVLRQTDPRYTVQREFALRHLPNFPLFRLVDACYQTFPEVLTKHGKTKNPYPNVDAHSGCLLQNYGMTNEDFYTVLFGVSRSIGVLSALTWNRALGIAIERPKSITTAQMCEKFNVAV